jgi:acyl phosphate:glycerol-3-phosphate acyltransferase
MISIVMVPVSFLSAYLLGSFPTSFILARTLKGIDIRQVGSGNAGATNVLRSVGRLPAVITLVVDILKGALAVTLLTSFFYSFGIDLDYDFYRSFMGLAVVCGHIWSVFLKFKGGKGIATTLGVAIGIAPKVLVPSVIMWIIVFVTTKYVSLASIIALIIFPIVSSISGVSIYITLMSIIICGISIYKHKDNIKRLVRGSENKTHLSKKK